MCLLGLLKTERTFWPTQYLYTHVHTSIIHDSQKVEETKCPSSDKWIKKMWCVYIYTMEYYSALKRNEILTHATTWMKLEDIMLSELSQLQKDKYCMIPLI